MPAPIHAPSRVRSAALGLMLMLGLTHAGADPARAGALTVHATGFKDTQGHAIAKLFLPGDDVLRAGRWETRAEIRDGQATLRFPSVVAGRYAVVVFHDRNDNGRIDHGLFGPSEPLGFSGGFVLSLLSGRPTFEALKFDFDGTPATLDLAVK